MKVNKIFHWLYFLVLLLPVFVIPIFAIYTRNESNTFENNIELQIEQNLVVDFNQKMEYESLNINQPFGINRVVENERINDTIGGVNYVLNHIYYRRVKVISYTGNLELSIHNSSWRYGSTGISSTTPLNTFIGTTFTPTIQEFDNIKADTGSAVTGSINTTFYVSFFDLTQMFGSGNEPTIQQFNEWYPNDYYVYTISEKQLIKNVGTTTLNNTDIGSQFLYSVYKPINDYFNFDNVFNFGQLYDWLQLNFFNGNAPLGFFVFWHLLIYWLLTSLLWLLFDVLIYVPKLIHRWLDKADIA